jgi:DNA-binding MarR family transcriptional regulator
MSKQVPFTTTAQIRDTCLCLHVQRAARALARRFDDALRPVGLTSGQFSLLNALNRPEPTRLGPVAQLLAMDRTTVTAALKPLEREGLVEITTDPDDRRNRRVRLTDKGHGVLASALPIWIDVHTAIEASSAGTETAILRSQLKVLSQQADPAR